MSCERVSIQRNCPQCKKQHIWIADPSAKLYSEIDNIESENAKLRAKAEVLACALEYIRDNGCGAENKIYIREALKAYAGEESINGQH